MQIANLSTSAATIMNSAQKLAGTAAQNLANFSSNNENDKTSGGVLSNGDIAHSLINLQQAELETYAGVKMLKVQHNLLGSLLNMKV